MRFSAAKFESENEYFACCATADALKAIAALSIGFFTEISGTRPIAETIQNSVMVASAEAGLRFAATAGIYSLPIAPPRQG